MIYCIKKSNSGDLFSEEIDSFKLVVTEPSKSKIDVSTLSKGTYLVKVQNANQVVVKRFLKN